MKLKDNNSSRKYFTGQVFHNKYGEIEVVGQVDRYALYKGRKNYRHFLVRFKDGTEVVAMNCNIAVGNIKNPNTPHIFNIGYIGQGRHKSKQNNVRTREYDMWYRMMQRCYYIKGHIKNPSYKDCTVGVRWHNFQNFAEDIKLLDGYELWFKNAVKVDLDKDLKVENNKVYSKDMCSFVLASENRRDSCIKKHIKLGHNIKVKEIG